MLGVITGFIDELRSSGIPVSMVETIDAMRALEAVEIADRTALRETLRATLVKNLRHERAFDTAFDVYFSTLPPPPPPEIGEGRAGSDPSHGQGGAGDGDFDLDALIDSLLNAMAGLDEDALRRGAREAVDRLAGMEPGRPVGGTYYLYRTLRRLDMARLEAKLLEALLAGADLSDFERRLLAEEIEARLDLLR
ncbi:MAG TPA: hypothetical protein VGA97_07380, partial [Acidimicrobiia bacterium]